MVPILTLPLLSIRSRSILLVSRTRPLASLVPRVARVPKALPPWVKALVAEAKADESSPSSKSALRLVLRVPLETGMLPVALPMLSEFRVATLRLPVKVPLPVTDRPLLRVVAPVTLRVPPMVALVVTLRAFRVAVVALKVDRLVLPVTETVLLKVLLPFWVRLPLLVRPVAVVVPLRVVGHRCLEGGGRVDGGGIGSSGA